MTDRPEPARRLASDIRLAIASNAIAAAVRERGDWLRLSTRDSAAHAVLAALDRAEEQAAAGGPITLGLTAHTEPDVLRCSLAVLGQPHEAGLWEPQPGMPPVRCPGHPAAPGGLREEIARAAEDSIRDWDEDIPSASDRPLHEVVTDAVLPVVERHLARQARKFAARFTARLQHLIDTDAFTGEQGDPS